MITVYYEKYLNDYCTKDMVENFSSLDELAEWMFSKVHGEYKTKIFFIDPDSKFVYSNGKLKLDSSCISVRDGQYCYWVRQIKENGKIIYSEGTYTNKICHWNEEVKHWLKKNRERVEKPVFNFG